MDALHTPNHDDLWFPEQMSNLSPNTDTDTRLTLIIDSLTENLPTHPLVGL